ncbi:GumC family protein [Desulforhopalus sp. 52FAK]
METPSPQVANVKQIVDIVLRRKAIIAFGILIGLTVGLPYYLTVPKVYQGTALLSYQQQRINPNSMSPDEQEQLQDIVSTLTDIVTSRTSLEKIIKNEDLYSGMRENLPMEDVVVSMRKKINITPSRRGDTFVITYETTDVTKVARVTNSIASGFIEENLKYREDRAADTSAYTKDELEMAKEILDKKEAIMRDYKLQHYNEMSEQLQVNMARLNSLQEQYQGRQESIQELERTRVLIRDQIEVRKQVLAGMINNPAPSNNRPVQAETPQASLLRLQNTLKTLQERYTDQHPKIKSLKRKIAVLEKQTANPILSETATDTPAPQNRQNFDATLFDLENEIKGIGLSIQRLNNERVEINKAIKQYEQWVGATPIREAEWSALTREHGELRRHYDFLVSQDLQAGSALNLERKQKGSQFKIVDTATTPVKPIRPNFIRMIAIALAGGAGVAGGIIVGLEFLNTTFRDPDLLEKTFGIEVICSVPYIPLKSETTKSRIITSLGTAFVLSWAVSLCIAMLYLWQRDLIIL